MSAPLSMLRYAPSPALAAFRARAKLEATWWTKQLKRASVSDFLGGAPAVADADARQARGPISEAPLHKGSWRALEQDEGVTQRVEHFPAPRHGPFVTGHPLPFSQHPRASAACRQESVCDSMEGGGQVLTSRHQLHLLHLSRPSSTTWGPSAQGGGGGGGDGGGGNGGGGGSEAGRTQSRGRGGGDGRSEGASSGRRREEAADVVAYHIAVEESTWERMRARERERDAGFQTAQGRQVSTDRLANVFREKERRKQLGEESGLSASRERARAAVKSREALQRSTPRVATERVRALLRSRCVCVRERESERERVRVNVC